MKIISLTLTLTVLLSVGLATRSVRAQSASSRPSAVSYQQILDYLALEVKEEKIIRLVQESPVEFQLGADQVAQLKEAGASESLLAALRKELPASQRLGEISDIQSFLFVLDCSGSMKEPAEPGLTKFEAAQRAAMDLIQSVPAGKQLAFVVYGHDMSRRCGAVDLVRELSPLEAAGKQQLAEQILDLTPSADTPLAASLEASYSVLRDASGLAKVVVITDGMETCQGDPAAAAARLAALPHLRGGVDVIGFGLKPEEVAAVERIARAGQGQFYNADNVARLRASVATVQREIAKPKPRGEGGLSILDQKLIRNLADKDCSVSAQAAIAIGKRKLQAARDPLAQRIADDRWETGIYMDGVAYTQIDPSKHHALEALLVIDAAAAHQALLEGLGSNTREVRWWAIKRLGELRVEAAVQPLTYIVASENWETGFYFAGLSYTQTDPGHDLALRALQNIAPQAAEEALGMAADAMNPEVRAWGTKMLIAASEGK